MATLLMKQFLIRPGENGQRFNLRSADFDAVLRPSTLASQAIKGSGDHRLDVHGCQVAFTFEKCGIQISFEGNALSQADAFSVVTEIAANITKATGQQARVAPL